MKGAEMFKISLRKQLRRIERESRQGAKAPREERQNPRILSLGAFAAWRLSSGSFRRLRFRTVPSHAGEPAARAFHVEVDDRGREEGEDLGDDEASHDRDAERG